MLALAISALAAPLPDDPVGARLSGRLREAARQEAEGTLDTFRSATFEPAPPDALSVSIEAEDADSLVAALTAAGIGVEARAGDRVQASVPYARLREVAGLPGVRRVREPARASAKERVTEGYAAIMERDWHDDGYDGAGVKIGIVDVGFSRFDAVGNAEVPADAITDFSRGRSESTTHGTAVTEIVYDFAPGATYYLASFSTEVELGEVLAWFVEEEVDVINASIGFDNIAHADGWSYVTRLAEETVDAGVIYVAAAGNENDKYRVGALQWAPGGGVALAGLTTSHAYTWSGFADVSLRWSEPFGEAANDFDLVVTNEDGSECGRSDDPQDGDDDPYEKVSASGCSDVVTVAVVAGDDAADPFGLEGYLYAPAGIDEAEWTGTEDLTLPGDTRGGISVGGWYVATEGVPDWSSRGPTNDGRTKPDVVAPTAVSTATYGRGGFEGSSAAAPHVTGLAALWVQASGRRGEPEVFRQWLRAHAEDVGDEGLDEASGAGLVRADALPPTGCGCASGAGEGSVVVLATVALVVTRRRT